MTSTEDNIKGHFPGGDLVFLPFSLKNQKEIEKQKHEVVKKHCHLFINTFFREL